MELGLLFISKNDLAISSRITDLNVQISAVNIHSQFSKIIGNNPIGNNYGNRLSRVSIDRGALGCASVNRTLRKVILNLSGQIDLPITLDTNCYTDPPMRSC